MDVQTAIETRIAVREFSGEAIEDSTKREILDAGRLAPSGKNLQHWRFILVDERANVARLAAMSTSGAWVEQADFAVVVLTDPQYPYHDIDAGRATTHMQFAAWAEGIGSCIYTGFDEGRMYDLLDIPPDYNIAAVIGFGVPTFDPSEITARKDRKALSTVAYDGRFGRPLERFE